MTKKLFFLFIAAQLSVGLCAQSVTVYNPAIQNKVPEQQSGAVSEVETDTVPADFSAIVTEGDATLISWETSDPYPFVIEGTKAVSSNQGVGSSISFMQGEFTVDVPYTLSFDYSISTMMNKVSTDDGGYTYNIDRMNLYIDGETYMWAQGTEYEESAAVNVDKGHHTFRIEYVKDAYGDALDDEVTMRNISLLPRVSDFTQLSPDGSVTDFTVGEGSNGWGCYEGVAQNLNNGDDNSEAYFYINIDIDRSRGIVLDYSVSSQENSDFLSFYIDDATEAELSVSGEQSGKFYHNFAAGSHSVKVVYKKDGSGSEGRDIANVSRVRLLEGEYVETVKEMTAIVHASHDEELNFVGANLSTQNFTTRFTFSSDGEVLIENLMNLPADKYASAAPLRATVTDDNKIVLETPRSKENKWVLGERIDDFYGSDMPIWAVLVTGDFDAANGWLYDTNSDKVVFTINEDTTMITPDRGFGAMDVYEFGTQYLMLYYVDAAYVIPEEKGVFVCADTIAVPRRHVGEKAQLELLITNNGGVKSTVYAETDLPDEFAFETAALEIEALGGRDTLCVTFTAAEAGEFVKSIRLYDDTGWEKRVYFAGEVLPPIDYSDIVTEGKELITWSTSEEYPWDVILGEAFSTNVGVGNSSSWLTATFTVPENYIAMLAYEGMVSCGMDDKLTVTFNDETPKTYQGSFFSAVCEYKEERNLEAGEYNIVFDYVKDAMNNSGDDRAMLKNVKLKVIELKDDNVLMDVDTVDFGLVQSKQEARAQVTITNVGRNDFSITEVVSNDTIFGGVAPETSIATLESMTVELTVVAPRDGSYEGIVTLRTTAGDLPIVVKAEAENALYIGSQSQAGMSIPMDPSVYGEDKIQESAMLYIDSQLAQLKDCNIKQITYYMLPDFYLSETNWAEMDVKWEVGATDLTELTADGFAGLPTLTEVYNGGILQFKDKEMTIVFDEPLLWEGGDKLLVKYTGAGGVRDVPIYFKASMTSYQSAISSSGYTSTFLPNIKITYDLPNGTDGVVSVANDSDEVVGVYYVDLTGIVYDEPCNGVNIVVTKYRDGSIATRKMIVRK